MQDADMVILAEKLKADPDLADHVVEIVIDPVTRSDTIVIKPAVDESVIVDAVEAAKPTTSEAVSDAPSTTGPSTPILIARKSSLRKPGAPRPNKTVTLDLDDAHEVTSMNVLSPTPSTVAALTLVPAHPHLIRFLVWIYTNILCKSPAQATNRALKLKLYRSS
jgi:hypothetical protein